MPVTRLNIVKKDQLDKNNVFVEVHSDSWRAPNKMSIFELTKDGQTPLLEKYEIFKDIDNETIIIDPSTLKIKIDLSKIIAPSVFSETFINQNIQYTTPPINSLDVSGMTLVTDGNYLYVWIESQKRWKRCLLTEW